jgi:hypothetical protein
MLFRLILGAFLSAMVLMVWGAVFWVATPVPYEVMKKHPQQDALARMLKEQNLESGTYFIPFPDKEVVRGGDMKAMQELDDKMQEGPLIQLTYRKEGVNPSSPVWYALGFGHFFVSALLVGGLLVTALPGLRSYVARWLFVSLVGIFAAVAIHLSFPIWFHHPWGFALMEAGFAAVGWLLAGAVMAAVVRKRSTASLGLAGPHRMSAEGIQREAGVRTPSGGH